MADTAALVVALSAQLTKFEQDMKQAGNIADRAVRDIEKRTTAINPFGGLTKGLAAFLSIEGLREFITSIKEATHAIAEMADQAERVGLSTDQFQKLQFAIVASGGSAEAASTFMDRFSRSLSEAQNNSGQLFQILKANKIDPKGITDTNAALELFANLVRNAKTPQDALNLAMSVGGREAGPALVQALQGGAAGLKAAGEEAKRFGTVLDEEFIQKAKDADTAFSVLALSLNTTFNRIKANVGSKLKEIIDEITNFQTTQRSSFVTVTPPGAETNLPDPLAEQFRKLLEAQKKRADLLNAETQAVGQAVGVQQQLRTAVELTASAKEAEITLTPERIAAINNEAAAVGKAAQTLDDARRKWEGLQTASAFAGNQLVDVIDQLTQKTQDFGQIMQSVLRSVTRELLQAAITGQGAFANLLGTASKVQGGTGGLFGALVSAIPKFASGGVAPGGLAVVGERGPEIVALPRGTQIIPNAAAGSFKQPSARTMNISVDVTGANGDKAIEAAVNRGVARAVQQSVSIVNSTAPSRQLRFAQLGT